MCGNCVQDDGVGVDLQEASETPNAKRPSSLRMIDTCPRTRILAAIIFAFVVASLSSISSASLALIFSLIITLSSQKPIIELVKRLLVVNAFIIFLWFMLPFSFSTPGTVIASLGPLKVTSQGVTLAALITLKANAIFFTVVALLTQGPLYEIALAGKSLGAPKKLVNLILLSSRYFHVIFAEYQRLRLAMRARGFNSNFSRHTFLSLSNLMGMLLVRSWDRADRIHKAMLARGYDGDLHASSNFHFSQADVLFSLAIILVTIILLVFEWFPTI